MMFNLSLVARSFFCTAIHFFVDSFLLVGGMAVAAWWRFGQWLPPIFARYLPAVLLAALVLPCVFYVGGLYANSPRRVLRGSRIRWVMGGVGTALLVMLSMGTVDLEARVGRGVVGVGIILVAVFCGLHHLWLHRRLKRRQLRAVCVVSSVEDEMAAEIVASGGDRVVIEGLLPVGGYVPTGQLAVISVSDEGLLRRASRWFWSEIGIC